MGEPAPGVLVTLLFSRKKTKEKNKKKQKKKKEKKQKKKNKTKQKKKNKTKKKQKRRKEKKWSLLKWILEAKRRFTKSFVSTTETIASCGFRTSGES